MRFVIFVIDSQTESAASDEMANIDRFNESLVSGGHFILAAGISAPAKAFLIDNRQELEVTTGSLFNTESFYSGFWIISAESIEQAKQLAAEGSKACNRKVELRPFLGQ